MRKAVIAVCIVFVCFIFLGAQTASAETIPICADPSICEYSSIGQAINAATPGDVITLSGIHIEANIVITKDLTIRGENPNTTVIQGGAAPCASTPGRIFTVSGAQVRLENLTVRNGCATADGTPNGGQGGGIWNGGSLTLENVYIYGNVAKRDDAVATAGDVRGGGLYNVGYVRIHNTTIAENEISDAAHAAYGGGLHNKGFASIQNSTFSANSATGPQSRGGAIYNEGVLDLLFVTIAYNSAENAGGGLYNNATAESTNTLFSTNTISGTGSASDCISSALPSFMDANSSWSTSAGCDLPVDDNLTLESLAIIREDRPPVHLPMLNSSILNAGDCTEFRDAVDQVGTRRPNNFCAIGAAEHPRLLLPMIHKPPRTDLIVAGVMITPSGSVRVGAPVEIAVEIRNAGMLAADKNFWVDLYINPTKEPPNEGNNSEVWRMLCHPVDRGLPECYNDQGIAWQVTQYVQGGETITLHARVSNPYFKQAESNWNGNFNTPGAKRIWVFVDSWGGPGVVNGYIDELPDGEENNRFGPFEVLVEPGAVSAADVLANGYTGMPRLRNLTINP